jgi:eukaryotic-like serine/threonine-protein kinase
MSGLIDGGGSDSLPPGTTLGRYEIRRLIGQGGMGCVYEAVHRDLKKRVAIKTLLPGLASNGDAKLRFMREGEAASRIRHPHVVDVTDVGAEGNVIYLVMEYLEGEDLARLIARQGFLTPTQAADIMLPVAAAIATAHEQGVIHRDLKPENVFLARTGYGGAQPKVLDFGISKVLGDSRARALTGTAATMGTMNYLPPEQLRAAREADARSDQYGLGTILYECVTGQRAFEEDNFYIVLKKIAEGVYPRPSAHRPGIPERMEAIIMRAMRLEPLDRFESVKQFGAALLDEASDSARMLWTPFFGAVPIVDPVLPSILPSTAEPPPATARPTTDRGRVATMVAPPASGPISGTMELPAPRKSVSTTMRNATGERALSSTFAPARRGRAALVIAGVALVGAVAALIVWRGGAGSVLSSGRREDPEQSTLDPAGTSRVGAETAAEKVQRERPPVAQPETPRPLTQSGASPGSRPEWTAAGPGEADTAKPGDEAPTAKAGSAGGRMRKPPRIGHRLARGVRGKPPADEAPADQPEKPSVTPNGAPIIPL